MWLLESEAKKQVETFYNSGFNPDAEQQREFEARMLGEGSEGISAIMDIVEGTASINIQGIITTRPSFMMFFMTGSNVTHSQITDAVMAAEDNSKVDNIVLNIDSPGGQMGGLIELLETLQAVEKPTKAVVSGMAASAAFGIAAQADEIIATNRGSVFGSVGVLTKIAIDDNEVTITSDDAPNKAPDVTTKKGIKAVKTELNEAHDLFAEMIATGRGITVEKVNANFGQGGTMLAEKAKKMGLIDAIQINALAVSNGGLTAKLSSNREVSAMDVNELKEKHLSIYNAVVAIGAQEGCATERDRVTAHLVMGESSGDMKTAMGAIKDGAGMTATLNAQYLSASINKADLDARNSEDDGTGKVLSGQSNVSSNSGVDMVALVAEKLGKKV